MNIKIYPVKIFAVMWLTMSFSAISQTHDGHSSGMKHESETTTLPVETGQSAFAAIAEIVALLEKNPDTDWSMVDIDALRSHLVDMNSLTLSASVSTKELNGQAMEFYVTGEDRTLQAIKTMIPAHAAMVRNSTDWAVEVIDKPDGVTLKVTTESTRDHTKLRALGFFGFMTVGAHHQLHHFQMSNGAGH